MTDLAMTLRGLDAAALTPLVRQALRRDDAEVSTWSHDAFGHSLDEVHGTARSTFRFGGTAHAADRQLPWTLVLKVVTAPGTSDDPASPSNGDREPLAYGSGFLDGITGVTAPRCFGVVAQPTGGYWLWLEDIVEESGRNWSHERYELAARHLGRFNGAHLTVSTPVTYPWLSRSPLRDAVRETSPGVARIREARDNSLVAQTISPDAASALLALLGDVEGWLDRLDAMPQAITHWDAHRANLVSRTASSGTIETVALDWAGLGWGAPGVELSKLMSQTVNFFGLSFDALPALDARLFDAYISGLRDTGWRGAPQAVRCAYVTASAARLIVRTASALELAVNPRARQGFERAAGLPFASLAAKFRSTLPYYLAHASEARRLTDLRDGFGRLR